MEDAAGPGGWGKHFRAFMMSAPAGADLLVAEHWTATNRIGRDPSWLDGTFGGWLEGNAVATPDGEVVDVPMRTDQPKVALLIETARGYGRGLLRGIVRYSRLHGGWAFYITPGDFEQALPEMRQWGGTGIIARLETPRITEAVLATDLPLVALDLSDAQLADGSPLAGAAEVRSDSSGAARLAAEYLLDRGFRQYAYVGVARRVWSRRRQAGFVDRLAEAGLSCEVYPQPRRKRDREWGREQATLAAWLRDLPKPVGVMACNDDRGRQVLEACRAAGVRVPEEAAVIGVDNDELLCDLSTPPLSSVALNTERGGFEAAALLDALMHGRPPAGRRIVVEPLRVETRQSTDAPWEGNTCRRSPGGDATGRPRSSPAAAIRGRRRRRPARPASRPPGSGRSPGRSPGPGPGPAGPSPRGCGDSTAGPGSGAGARRRPPPGIPLTDPASWKNSRGRKGTAKANGAGSVPGKFTFRSLTRQRQVGHLCGGSPHPPRFG